MKYLLVAKFTIPESYVTGEFEPTGSDPLVKIIYKNFNIKIIYKNFNLKLLYGTKSRFERGKF